MPVRLYDASDRPRILALREAHGTGFFFADPEVWPNHSTVVFEDGEEIKGALTGRLCVEGFLMVDPRLPAIRRWRVIRSLMDAGLPYAYNMMNVNEAHIGIPAGLEGYGDLLAKLPGFYKEERKRILVNLSELYEEKDG